MTNVFEKTISATILILFIIIIRKFLLHKIPKITFQIMWAVAVLHLLLPFSVRFPHILPDASGFAILADNKEMVNKEVESELKSENIKASSWHAFLETVQEVAYTRPDTAITNSSNQWNNNVSINLNNNINNDLNFYNNNAVFSDTISSTDIKKLEKERILQGIWFIGAVLFFIYFISMHICFRKKCAESIPIDSSFMPIHFLRKVNIRINDQISSPLTYGIISPVILLPKGIDWTNKKQLYMVLEHEAIHILRFDILYKWIMTAAVCLYWFNPFVWIMYVLADRDIELSCDEAVIKRFEKGYKAEYALALLNFEEQRRISYSIKNFSGNAIKERIEAIMKLKRTSIFNIILAVLFISAVTIMFVSVRQKEAEPDKSQTAGNKTEEENSVYFQMTDNNDKFTNTDSKTSNYSMSLILNNDGYIPSKELMVEMSTEIEKTVFKQEKAINDKMSKVNLEFWDYVNRGEKIIPVPSNINCFAIYSGKFYYVDTIVGSETGSIEEGKCKIMFCDIKKHFKDSEYKNIGNGKREIIFNLFEKDFAESKEIFALEDIVAITNFKVQQNTLYCHYLTSADEPKIVAVNLLTNEITNISYPQKDGIAYKTAGVDKDWIYYINTQALYRCNYDGGKEALLYEFKQEPEYVTLLGENFYAVYQDDKNISLLVFDKLGRNVCEFTGLRPAETISPSFSMVRDKKYVYLAYDRIVYQFEELNRSCSLVSYFRYDEIVSSIELMEVSSSDYFIYFSVNDSMLSEDSIDISLNYECGDRNLIVFED